MDHCRRPRIEHTSCLLGILGKMLLVKVHLEARNFAAKDSRILRQP